MPSTPAEPAHLAPSSPLQRGLSTARRFPLYLTAAIFLLSLAVTFGLWHSAREDAIANLRTSFDSHVRETVHSIRQRMATYEQVVRGVTGLLAITPEVSRDDFRKYVASLQLQANYPGIQGIARVEIVPKNGIAAHEAKMRAEGLEDYAVKPAGPRGVYSSIVQIEPYVGMNLRATGFDMLTEPVRRAAMERARDTGQPAMSGKLTLIQETKADPQPGVIIYFPVFAPGAATRTPEERRAALRGWVGAPFRMIDLMANIGGELAAGLHIRIYDGRGESDAARLYDSQLGGTQTLSPQPLFSTVMRIDIAGRPWSLALDSTPDFERELEQGKTRFIAATGFLVSLLLAALVWALATGRGRALHLATAMTRELRGNEFRWKKALDGAGDGVWDWDVRNGRADFSQRWKEMLGYGEDELDSDAAQWEKLIHPADREQALEALNDYLSGKSSDYVVEHRMRCKDGSWKWILSRGMIASRDDSGEVLRMIGTHADITNLKRGEEALQLEAERIRSLEDARTALQHAQKLEAVGKLTGGVAHDFNNVLQIIAGNLQLLQVHFGEHEQIERRVANALDAVERGAKLSSQLLAFARRQPLQPRVLNLPRLIQAMDDMLRQAVGGSIDIDTTIVHEPWNICVDPHQLENVILNLAINARDAMQGKGQLRIEFDNILLDDADPATPDAAEQLAGGEYVVLTISDTGSGMTPEVVSQAFEPFFTTKPEGQGTGLGLSMAYGFIKQSGGDIRIYSAVGAGTTLRIYLPRCHEAEPEESADAPRNTAAGGAETILVVEDNPGVQATAISMLSELGYQVISAADGDSALRILESEIRIDLLFTDVVMPGSLSGPDLAKRARELFPCLAVLFTSGYTRKATGPDEQLNPGARLLSKPYRREQLAQEVRQALQRNPAQAMK